MSQLKHKFPHLYRKRGGDRDVSARATHLKAAMENVSVATIERKQMSNKTTFKRIALAVVGALSFGVLASGPSSAAIVANSETLTLSASSVTVTAGETATVTVTNSYIAGAVTDTTIVGVTGAGAVANAATTGVILVPTTDSANTVGTTYTALRAHNGSAVSDLTAWAADTSALTAANAFTKTVYTIQIRATANVGSHIYTVYSAAGTDRALRLATTFTLTVTANSSTVATAANSKFWLNRSAEYNAVVPVGTAAADVKPGLERDSALVVSAGTAATPVSQAVIHWIPNNTSDTRVATTGANVDADLILVNTGPGLLSNGTDDPAASSKTKQITLDRNETAVVWSDGSVGTGTIAAYLGSVSPANLLTQAAKTIVFGGKATTFTPKAVAAIVGGGTIGYSDSTTAGTAIVTFTAADAASNAVTSAALNTTTQNPTTGKFYVISSDTRVVHGGFDGTRKDNAECSYTSATVGFTCNLLVVDSGTVTLTIADSTTVSNAPTKSSAVTITVSGAASKGTIALDKAAYTAGEKAILTITAKDRADRVVSNAAHNPFFNFRLDPSSKDPTFAVTTGGDAAGGTFTNLVTYVTSGTTFVNGTDTAVVYMPTVAGTYTFIGGQAGETTTPVSLTFTVIDESVEAANSALDAAQEATDAAIAATDAAILAQEAADEAASAAVAAQETAQAAVDAVTALSAEVTKLVAQLATLQKLLNRVAKRVGVKL
jgi:hypothetical protein